MKTDPTQEKLNKISAEFELELTRLIKTLNLISQSRELYKNHVENIQFINTEFKNRINDFKIKLLEAERGNPARTGTFESSLENTEANLTLMDELNEYIEQTSFVIEKSKDSHIAKIDSVYSVLNLELQSAQHELDIKLQALQQQIAEIQLGAGQIPKPPPQKAITVQLIDEPSVEEKEEGPSNLPHVQRQEVTSNLEPETHYTPTPSPYGSQILIGLVLLFFGTLIGILVFFMVNTQDNQNYEQNSTAQITADDKAQTKEMDKISEPVHKKESGVQDETLTTERTTEIPLTEITPEKSHIEEITQTPEQKKLVSPAESETTIDLEHHASYQSNQETKKSSETTDDAVKKDHGQSDIEKTSNLAKQDILNEEVSTAEITTDDKLSIGQALVIPIEEPTPKTVTKTAPGEHKTSAHVYVVKKGDTLSQIALKLSVRTKDLKSTNGLNSNILQIGQELKVPGAKAVETDLESGKTNTEEPAKTQRTKQAAKAPEKKSDIEKITQTPEQKKLVTPAETETTVAPQYHAVDQSYQEPKKPYETTHDAIKESQSQKEIEIKRFISEIEKSDQQAKQDRLSEEVPAPKTAAVTSQSPADTDLQIYTPRVVASIRGGPGTNYDWITSVTRGQRIYALGDKEGGWTKVKTPDGKVGWVSSRILLEVK